MREFLYRSISKTGADRLIWNVDASRLRILCYHGLCDDSLADAPWVPSFFVTRSNFEKQLCYLREHATVLPLGEAVSRLRQGSLPPRAVSLTFDDGYANNLELAVPLLQLYGMPATVFLSTAYMESGDIFPFLKLKLIELAGGSSMPDYKTSPIDVIIAAAYRQFADLQLTAEQHRALRPMTVAEVGAAAAASELIEFGAHTHTHCILGNESEVRRQEEIRTSVRCVRRWTGKPVRLFSYPNGQRGDFGKPDEQALRHETIEAAVTGIAGANDRRSDPLRLRRYPVGLYHNVNNFGAEITGVRSAVRSIGARFGL